MTNRYRNSRTSPPRWRRSRGQTARASRCARAWTCPAARGSARAPCWRSRCCTRCMRPGRAAGGTRGARAGREVGGEVRSARRGRRRRRRAGDGGARDCGDALGARRVQRRACGGADDDHRRGLAGPDRRRAGGRAADPLEAGPFSHGRTRQNTDVSRRRLRVSPRVLGARRDAPPAAAAFLSRHVLCVFTGTCRLAATVARSVVDAWTRRSPGVERALRACAALGAEMTGALDRLGEIAEAESPSAFAGAGSAEARAALKTLGAALDKHRAIQEELWPSIASPTVKALYDCLQTVSLGAHICGAGNGGHVLCVLAPGATAAAAAAAGGGVRGGARGAGRARADDARRGGGQRRRERRGPGETRRAGPGFEAGPGGGPRRGRLGARRRAARRGDGGGGGGGGGG